VSDVLIRNGLHLRIGAVRLNSDLHPGWSGWKQAKESLAERCELLWLDWRVSGSFDCGAHDDEWVGWLEKSEQRQEQRQKQLQRQELAG
jgi:hypothetical protein